MSLNQTSANDKFGIQLTSNELTYLAEQGKMFSFDADVSLSSTTETNVLYFKNPSGSGVNAKAVITYIATDSTQGIITTRFYSNPTVSANGSTLTPTNNLIETSPPASAMQIFTGPTASARGTKLISLVASVAFPCNIDNLQRTIILAPGNSLLISTQMANIGLLSSVLAHYYFQWTEE